MSEVELPTEPAAEPIALAEGFPVLDRGDWRALAAAVLNRGRPEGKTLTGEQAESRLRTTTVSGVPIDALYLRPQDPPPLGHPGVMPFTRGSSVRSGRTDAWQIRQLHDDPDVATTHRAVLDDLERGVTAVWFHLGADGLAATDLPAVLEGVMLDLAPVHVTSHDDQIGTAEALLQRWREAGLEGSAARGGLGLDRLGAVARGTQAPAREDVIRLIRTCAGSFPLVRALTVDVTIHHDAGAGEVEELACAVATAVTYLRSLERAGVPASQSYPQIEFRVAATADQFLTIAKLRALRRLWARVGEVCGVPAQLRGAYQHAVTSRRMLTRDDPWVNILRTTTACFGAAVGGAEAITCLPYDTVVGLPDPTSRRIARNTQVLLAEESNLGRVADPGGGGWYIESLTNELAERAWAWFQEIDDDGGMETGLENGRVADRIAQVSAVREQRLADRSQPITGVSMFPPAREEPIVRTPRATVEPRTRPVLAPRRDAEVFEALRDRATSCGTPPRVLLACLGTRRDFGARETFTSALLHVAGITPVLSEGGDPEQIAARLTEAGLDVAVLCSSTGQYAEHGVRVAEALRAAGARQVLVAGRATELGPEAPPGVVDTELYSGMDVVTFLSDLLDTLGAPE